jgi:hypothetical protein
MIFDPPPVYRPPSAGLRTTASAGCSRSRTQIVVPVESQFLIVLSQPPEMIASRFPNRPTTNA